MNGKLKAMGLALVAAMAMSAVAASGASAETGQFNFDAETTTLDTRQDGAAGSETATQRFVTTVGELHCDAVEGSTTVFSSSEVTIQPQYSGCERIDDGVKTHVHMNSCAYIFTATKVGDHSAVHIECTDPGDHIEVKATFLGSEFRCTAVPPQTPTGGGVSYHNEVNGGKSTVTVEATLTGIEYTEVGACDEDGGEPNVANDGTYNGNAIVEGTNAAKEETNISWVE